MRSELWLAAKALVDDVRPGWREDMRQTVAQSRVDALRAALSAPAPQAEAAPKAGAGEAVEMLRGLLAALKAEVNEKGSGGYLLARISEAEDFLAHPAPASPAMAVVEAKARAYDGVLAALKAGENAKLPFGQVMADLGMDSMESVERIYFATPLRAAQEPPRAEPAEGGEGVA